MADAAADVVVDVALDVLEMTDEDDPGEAGADVGGDAGAEVPTKTGKGVKVVVALTIGVPKTDPEHEPAVESVREHSTASVSGVGLVLLSLRT